MRSFLRACLADDRTNAAFIVVVITAYILTLISAPTTFYFPSGLLIIGAGFVYLLVGLFGCNLLCHWVGNLPARIIQLAVEILVGSFILRMSQGFAWLILMPLPAQAVSLPRVWMLTFSALTVVASALNVASTADTESVIRAGVSFLAAVVFVIVFTQIAVREERARAEVERLAAELRAANRKLREYALQAEELATTKERNRLAREIHDSLGHYLTTINIQIEAALAVGDSDRARALDSLKKAQALSKEGLAEVRRSVAALRDTPLQNRSLAEGIRHLVGECRDGGILAELQVSGLPHPLSPQAELTLYRAAQEGLTNLRKHAHASRADVVLDYRADCVRLTVRDNGVGNVELQGGFGLLGIRERVQLLGGQVQTLTAPGQGLALQVELPYTPAGGVPSKS